LFERADLQAMGASPLASGPWRTGCLAGLALCFQLPFYSRDRRKYKNTLLLLFSKENIITRE